jgi:hypothetical protein
MNKKELFEMLLSKNRDERNLAEAIVDAMICNNQKTDLVALQILLDSYLDYPGYDAVVCKERVDEKIVSFLRNKGLQEPFISE